MRLRPALLLASLPLFTACQWLAPTDSLPPVPSLRVQGELSMQGDDLQLTPCGSERHQRLVVDAGSETGRALRDVVTAGSAPLFIDLRGTPGGAGGERLHLTQLYRLQAEGYGCSDPGFRRRLLQASGHEPDWSVQVGRQGLVLQRPGQPALALPYLEERLPDGSLSLSSEADGMRVELWLTPGLCSGSMGDSLQHLQARLRLGDAAPLHGCASFAGGRN